jgi:hypothetical protein
LIDSKVALRREQSLREHKTSSALSAPRGAIEGALIVGAGVNRLAVRDDHALERKIEQRA